MFCFTKAYLGKIHDPLLYLNLLIGCLVSFIRNLVSVRLGIVKMVQFRSAKNILKSILFCSPKNYSLTSKNKRGEGSPSKFWHCLILGHFLVMVFLIIFTSPKKPVSLGQLLIDPSSYLMREITIDSCLL